MTHGGLGDAQLVAYTLEHGYRWVIQMQGHQNFWNPPIFYPYPSVSAFTEVLLGVGPFYWIWRALGLAPDSSFQLWMLTVWSLNFWTAYLLLRHGFSTRSLAATCGAVVFAFGTTAQAHFAHPQLAPLFFVALAVLALLRLLRPPLGADDGPRKGWWIALLVVCVILQAYTCFYTFFFFGLLLGLALIWALVLPSARGGLLRAAREHRMSLMVGGVCCALALGYLASHYLATAETLGARAFDPDRVPSWSSWIRLSGRNELYGWVNRFVRERDWSLEVGRNGMGLIPLGLSIFAFYRYRSRTAVQLLLLACATLIVLATSWGGFSLWKIVHEVVPGAAALRALKRVGIILRLLAGVGVALGVQALLERRRVVWVAGIVVVGFAELLHGHIWVDKYLVRDRVAELAELVDPQSEAFFMVCSGPQFDPHVEELAEWVSLETGVPTINGRYGNYPPNWGLKEAQANALLTEDQRQEYQAALRRWCEGTGIDYDRVQWIEYPRVRIPRVRGGALGRQKTRKRSREPKSPRP